MNDEQQEQSQKQSQPAASPFVQELTQLGRNFSQLIRDALESPQLQEVRKEVATGAQTVIEEINDAVGKARESQVTQNVAQKAAKTAEDLKSSPVTENIKTGLLNALRSVNDELSDIVQKMDQAQQKSGPSAAAPEASAPPPAPEPQAEPDDAA